jgi:hypothetical protein
MEGEEILAIKSNAKNSKWVVNLFQNLFFMNESVLKHLSSSTLFENVGLKHFVIFSII